MTQGKILNVVPARKCGLVVSRDGRIMLRARPCRLLDLSVGDKIIFYYLDGQMYLYKDNASPVALALCGRPSQLHCCSVSTARQIFIHTTGADGMQRLELPVSPSLECVSVEDSEHQALAVINVIKTVQI